MRSQATLYFAENIKGLKKLQDLWGWNQTEKNQPMHLNWSGKGDLTEGCVTEADGVVSRFSPKKFFGFPQNLRVCLISSVQLREGERVKVGCKDDKLEQGRYRLVM